MIRFKDQTFDQYSIDPVTAVITDQNGVVQNTYVKKNGRAYFKGMHVHCIQVHTHLGYKPDYVVHHKDENPLNNSLSNLVYLTRTEHTKLHMKGNQYALGNHLSEEHRAKMLAALKSKLPWNKGKPLSKEAKEKISASMKGKLKSEEQKLKISATLKGRHLSEEIRAKISASLKSKSRIKA